MTKAPSLLTVTMPGSPGTQRGWALRVASLRRAALPAALPSMLPITNDVLPMAIIWLW
ncbi:hypothetical protein [Streptomyces hydrogenans]|uniref:hypothetical protein n=1 Tax=Streptomyces hydrogenans TaxID=1873719 RepID=UPI0035D700B5